MATAKRDRHGGNNISLWGCQYDRRKTQIDRHRQTETETETETETKTEREREREKQKQRQRQRQTGRTIDARPK